VEEGSFLKSTSDIPEPHEFSIVLSLSLPGDVQRYDTAFTEDAHGHSYEHGHGHSHGSEGHSHERGKGLLGWVRGTFAHSHAAADKMADERSRSLLPPRQQTQESPTRASVKPLRMRFPDCKYVCNAQLNILILRDRQTFAITFQYPSV